MTQENLMRLQKAQLMIMDEIHRLCEKHHIVYYMIGGTLLGAVRHKGFIPWDIDIDIAMTRADYTRFKEVCLEELSEPFFYADYLTEKNFNHPHALVCLRGTRVTRNIEHLNPHAAPQPIYLDIFPLDNVPTSEKAQKKQKKKLRWLRNFKQLRIGSVYKKSAIKSFAKRIVRALLSWISIEKINEIQQEEMQKYSNEDSGFICSMASQYAYEKQRMPRQKYGTPVLLEYEGRKYYAPQDYIWYLERLYGDYMKIPPKHEQEKNLAYFAHVDFGELFCEEA